MKWYVAELVIECQFGRGLAKLWDQQLVLIYARNADAAYTTAKRLGKKQETTYSNSEDEKVRWKFKGLSDLQELLVKTIRSGVEVHSMLSRVKRPRIRTKNKLTVFWTRRNLNKTAAELLDG
jgi:hypothetical protein